MKVWLIELHSLDPANQPHVLRLAVGAGFQNRPTDNPPAVWWAPDVLERLSFESSLFDQATTYGASRIGWGSLQLVNPDGRYDYLLRHAIDGQPLQMWLADTEQPFSAAVPMFRGRMERLRADAEVLTVEMLDRLVDLDKPLCAEKFVGTDQAPVGVDGREDLKDKRKQRIYGTALNVSPLLVNPSKGIWLAAGNLVSLSAVREKGVPLLPGAEASSQADLEATAPPDGRFRLWAGPKGVFLRLSGDPKQPTFDAASVARVGSLIRQVLMDAGVPAADISTADVAALDARCPGTLGIVVTDDATALDTINQLAASVGAWVTVDRSDQFRLGVLDVPSDPVMTISPAEIVRGSLRIISSGNDDRGLPASEIELEFDRNWTVQSDLETSAGATMQAWAKLASRKETVKIAAVEARHKLAKPLQQQTLLRQRWDAEAEAFRRSQLYGVLRHTYELEAQLDAAQIIALQLGGTVKLKHPRFDLADGKLVRVIGMSPDLQAGRLKLKLWG